MKKFDLTALVAAVLLTCSPMGFAAEPVTLAEKAGVKVTADDLQAHQYLTPNQRREVLLKRRNEVEKMVADIFAPRLYAMKKVPQLDLTPDESRFVDMQVERASMSAVLAVIDKQVREHWTKPEQQKQLESRARELWLVDNDKYNAPASADITQLLVSYKNRDFAAITKEFGKIKAALASGTSFDALVEQYKALQATTGDGGSQIKGVVATRVDGQMSNLIFSTLKEGQISEPMPSAVGVHLVRLDRLYPGKKREFSEVKESIIAGLVDAESVKARSLFIKQIEDIPMTFDEKGMTQIGLGESKGPVVTPEMMRNAQEQAEKQQAPKN